MTKKNAIIVLFFIIRSTTTSELDMPGVEAPFRESDQSQFGRLWYLLLYILFWSIVFDISLIIVIHFKQTSSYIKEHTVLNVMAIIGQFVNNFLLLRATSFNFSDSFIKREIALLIAQFAQLLLGAVLNKKLQSDQLMKGIFIVRFSHKLLGRIIYIASKIQIIIYTFGYFGDRNINSFLIIGLLLIIIAATHLTLLFILADDEMDILKTTDFLVNSSPRAEEYKDLLKNINAGELMFESDFKIADNLTVNFDAQSRNVSLMSEKNQINWVIIEDLVFDITGMRHPKGNYILKAIQFKDVTREVYGLKDWRFSYNGYTKVLKHRHKMATLKFLKNHCIGRLNPMEAISLPSNIYRPSISEANSNLDLFKSNFTVDQAHIDCSSLSWSVSQSYSMIDNSRMIFLKKIEKDYVINLSSYWLKNFSKYFIVKSEKNTQDYFYILYSLSPKYLTLKKEWYHKLNISFIQSMQTYSSFDLKELTEIGSTLQKSNSAIKMIKESSNDIKDAFIPLYVSTEMESKFTFEPNIKFEIKGPFGLGLGFDANSTKQILIMIKDEGVLPFTDFFEFISQRALIELNGLKQPHPIFGKEYLMNYVNDMAIWVYWEISQNFYDSAKVFGLESLEVFNHAAVESSKIFKNDQTKMCNVVKRINIISNKPSQESHKLSMTNCSGKNFKSIREISIDSEHAVISRVVVSGPTEFVNRALLGLEMPPEDIVVL
jgi:hypothetical protein